MIKLTDILKETMYVGGDSELSDLYDFQIVIEDGEITENDKNYKDTRKLSSFYNDKWDTIENGIQVQLLYFDTEEGYIDIGNHPNPKKYIASRDLEEYTQWLGTGLWTKDPLEKYKGDGSFYPLGLKVYTYEFDTFEDVEDFLKNELKQKLRNIYNL